MDSNNIPEEGLPLQLVIPERRPSVWRRAWLFLTTGWTAKKLIWWIAILTLIRLTVIPLLHSLD